MFNTFSSSDFATTSQVVLIPVGARSLIEQRRERVEPGLAGKKVVQAGVPKYAVVGVFDVQGHDTIPGVFFGEDGDCFLDNLAAGALPYRKSMRPQVDFEGLAELETKPPGR